jgi:hypothetical protein
MKWIDCNHRVPEINEKVLIYGPSTGGVELGSLQRNFKAGPGQQVYYFYGYSDGQSYELWNIDAWMPLPSPPTGEKT